ncbi:MAG TPA: TonB family protein [Methylophilaceae bacterium]|nr:TonB family protein [Methylophilaceae bacterium]
MTLAVSAFLHLVVIVAVKFEPPDLKFFKDKMPPLEVVLVNAKTEKAPTKADALAQANLDRGGNTEENRRLKSALPPPKQQVTEVSVKPAAEAKKAAAAAEAQAEAERKQQQRVAELERQAQELMTQINAKKKVETAPPKPSAAPEIDKQQQQATSKLSGADLMASSLDIARLEAQIAKQQDEYQKRPKRKFIGARTQEYRFATYVEAWRQKVEKVGNLNYPEAAKEQKIYGQLRMTVSIKSDGNIESIEVNSSSGFKVLDDAAKRIVELAAPYAAFPEDIRKDTDILSITRTWTFTKQDSLATE